jgi:replicative DNA helicase
VTIARVSFDRAAEEDHDLGLVPQDLSAEEAVLGSVLKDGLSIAKIAERLHPRDFYGVQNQHVYAAMHALFERGSQIDYQLIGTELHRQGTYEAAGGMMRLSEVDLATPSAAFIELYAEIVLDRAVRRRRISAHQKGAELAWDVRVSLEEGKERSEALVLGADGDHLGRRQGFRPDEWTASTMEYLGQAKTDGLAGVSTGLRDLDAMTLGLSKGWLYLVGARPGTGKTQLAAQVALHVGERHGPVVFVSMELTEADLGTRFVAIVTGIAKERLVTGNLDAAQQGQVTDALARLEQSRVHIAYGGFTTGGVRAFTLQAQAVEGVRPALIVVDYLQLLRDQEGDGRNREHNISQAARSLKGLAQELQVPVLALAQFNRDLNGRGDKRPALTDLRDSGDLENTADSVLGLYRDEMHHPDTDDKHLAEVVVLKKRQLGEDVGCVRRLMWLGEKYGDFDWQSANYGRLP